MRLTKQCRVCKNIKDLSAFSFTTANADGYKNRCKKCDQEENRRRLDHGQKRAIKAKIDYGKCDCHGITVTLENLKQFEWDHLDPLKKTYRISGMSIFSDKLFYEELAKCRLVCHSFHMAHTSQQRSQGLFGTNFSIINSPIIQKPAHQDSLFEEVTQ